MKFTSDQIEEIIRETVPENMLPKCIIRDETGKLPAPAASAITDKYQYLMIFYNRDMINDMTDGQPLNVKYVIQHELLHWSFGHCHNLQDDIKVLKKDPTKLNHAADCEVNSYIPHFTPNMVTAQKYNLPPRQTKDWYYDHIPEPKGGTSICSLASEEVQEAIKEIIQKAAKELGDKIGQGHPEDKVEIPRAVHRIPRGLASALNRIIGQACIKNFDKDNTFQVVHKWKPEGYPGKKRNKGPKLLFAIDCSGSTSGEQVQAFFNIVRRLCSEYEAHVVEFDDQPYHFGKKPSGKSRGGGTDMRGVQKLYDNKYDAIVWFTDGEGAWNQPKGKAKYIYFYSGNNPSQLPTKKNIIQYRP